MNIIIKSLKVDLLIIISYIYLFCDVLVRFSHSSIGIYLSMKIWNGSFSHRMSRMTAPDVFFIHSMRWAFFFIKHIYFFCERNTREKKNIHWATITWLIESQTTIITISNMLCVLSNGDEKKERQVGTCDQCGLFFFFFFIVKYNYCVPLFWYFVDSAYVQLGLLSGIWMNSVWRKCWPTCVCL